MEINNEMEKLYADTFHTIEEGAILTGKIIAVKAEGIIVDIGYKSEGFIRRTEFSEDEIGALKPGDTLEVYVVSMRDSEGVIRLSKDRASKIKTWGALEQIVQDGALVEGTVIEKTKGGLTVDIGGVKAFLPGSQIDIKVTRDLEALIGKKMMFRVLKINNKRSNVIVSRRAVLEEERLKKRGDIIGKIREGAVLQGTVKNITDYGVFVDLGGMDGLLHISDISWGRISHPTEFFTQGDPIEVVVLKYDEASERITLGYKQKQPDPWSNVTEKFPVGAVVKGRIVSIADYGAFVELENGLEGLVHISEIEWGQKLKHPSKYLSIGETVEAVVIKVDKEERKLSLSIKQMKPSPWELVGKQYQVGQRISGKVRGITDFGAFVGLPEGVDGLIHISDLSWTRHIKHPSEILKKGQKIDAVILSLDPENEKMALGLKQLEPDPWPEIIPAKFRLGEEAIGTVLRTTDFGIFIELEGGVEGLIYSSEVETGSSDSGQAEQASLKAGDTLTARIIRIDLEERKIGLSMKNMKKAAE